MTNSQLPRISIVTPSLNQGEFLEDCIQSILSQGYPELEYIIMDGGSTDGSVEIIKKYEPHLSYWQSRPDGGHYAAVADGFSRTTGDIMAWLNADDKFHPLALFKAAYVFDTKPEISWITGRPVQWSIGGGIEHVCGEDISFSRQRVVVQHDFQTPWIQQESTFWRRTLWEHAGRGPRSELALAGDLDLWVRFFRFAQLQFVDTLLGGNRRHPGQRSVRFMDLYLKEADGVLSEELSRPQPGVPSTALPRVTLQSSDFRQFLRDSGVPIALIAADEVAADLLDDLVILTQGHHRQVAANREAEAALKESEADRRSRLEVIHDLGVRLAETEADRTARLHSIELLEQRLLESEADRAQRLQSMQVLERLLAESEADRANRLKSIHALEALLADSEADRAARLGDVRTLEGRLGEIEEDREKRLTEAKQLQQMLLDATTRVLERERALEAAALSLDDHRSRLQKIERSFTWRVSRALKKFWLALTSVVPLQ